MPILRENMSTRQKFTVIPENSAGNKQSANNSCIQRLNFKTKWLIAIREDNHRNQNNFSISLPYIDGSIFHVKNFPAFVINHTYLNFNHAFCSIPNFYFLHLHQQIKFNFLNKREYMENKSMYNSLVYD